MSPSVSGHMDIHELDLKILSAKNIDLAQLEQMRINVLDTERLMYVPGILGILAFYFVQPIGAIAYNKIGSSFGFVVVLIIYLFAFYCGLKLYQLYKKIAPLKFQMKSWFLSYSLTDKGLQEVALLDKKTYESLKNYNFLLNLQQNNSSTRNLTVDDYIVFKYKQKYVEVVDFQVMVGTGKNSKNIRYLALAVQNPDKISGSTASWSDEYWNFEMKEKIETESVVFNKIFKTRATSQIDARLHLKTNVMQDMIDLNNSLSTKKSVFCFKDSIMMFILKIPNNFFELDYSKPLNDKNSNNKFISEIQSCLKIFDDFWLDRKSHLNNK